MGMLDALLGGAGARQTFDDFTRRYDRGAPWDGISDEEALEHHDRVARNLGEGEYRDAARESLARLSPEERSGLLAQLQQGARRADVNTPGLHDASDDPGALSGLLSRMHAEQPGIVQELLGGGAGGGLLGSPVAKGALAGIAAMAVRHAMGGGRGGP